MAVELDGIVDNSFLLIECVHHFVGQIIDGILNPAVFGVNENRHAHLSCMRANHLNPIANALPFECFLFG